MLVKELLKQKKNNIEAIKPDTSADDILEQLIRKRIGCLIVTDNGGSLVGIVSEKDVLRKIYELKDGFHNLTAQDMMSDKVIVALPDDDISYIAEIMLKNWIRHIPIVENDELVGLVSSRDVNHTLAKNKEAENRFLQQFMDGVHMRDMSGDL